MRFTNIRDIWRVIISRETKLRHCRGVGDQHCVLNEHNQSVWVSCLYCEKRILFLGWSPQLKSWIARWHHGLLYHISRRHWRGTKANNLWWMAFWISLRNYIKCYKKYLVDETALSSSKKTNYSQDHMTTWVNHSLIMISKTMSLVLQLQSAWALLRRPSCSTRRRLSTSSSGFQPRSSWECDTPPIQSWAWQYHWGQWSFLSRYSPSADRQCPDVNCRWNLVWRFVFKITLNISALVSSLRTASGLWCEVVDTLQRPK